VFVSKVQSDNAFPSKPDPAEPFWIITAALDTAAEQPSHAEGPYPHVHRNWTHQGFLSRTPSGPKNAEMGNEQADHRLVWQRTTSAMGQPRFCPLPRCHEALEADGRRLRGGTREKQISLEPTVMHRRALEHELADLQRQGSLPSGFPRSAIYRPMNADPLDAALAVSGDAY